MYKKTTNENLVKNSTQIKGEELEMSYYEDISLQVCEIQQFVLDDILDNPTPLDIEIWTEMSDGEWDGILLSDEIEELWKDELRKEIQERRMVNYPNEIVNESQKDENLEKNSNQSQNEEIMNDITKIDMYLIEKLSDWIEDELKYFRKDSGECTDNMCELIMSGEYNKKSPLMNYFDGISELIKQN